MDEPDTTTPVPLTDVSYSEPEPEVVSGEVVPENFEDRVLRLMNMIENDPAIRDRMLCEIYIGFTEMDRAMRTMAINGGPLKMLKAMMGKGGE